MVQLSLIFPKQVIETIGVGARLFGLLSGAGVNVYGELTSYAEHLLVINERDLTKALDVLRPREFQST